MRASLERAVADGRALLEDDAPIAWADCEEHLLGDRTRPRTVGASGAVMAVTLGVEAHEYATSEAFAPRWSASLQAIQMMRVNDWASAWGLFYGASATPDIAEPAQRFHEHLEAALARNGAAPPMGYFTTSEDDARWLDHVEGAVPAPLGAIEDALAEQLAQARRAPAPETIAEAVRIALADGRALADAARAGGTPYEFNCGVWHDGGRSCMVNTAGCVMAGTLATPPDATVYPRHFAWPWRCALHTIEAVRCKGWREAFNTMHGERHAGGKAFAGTMHSATHEVGAKPAVCAGLTQFEAWLDYVETDLLATLETREGKALVRH